VCPFYSDTISSISFNAQKQLFLLTGNGLDASNTWAETYVNTFVLDTFTMVIERIYNLL
jgi:hypothetical protein